MELRVVLVSEFVAGVGVGIDVDMEFEVGVDEIEVMEALEYEDAFMADIDAVFRIRVRYIYQDDLRLKKESRVLYLQRAH